MKRHCKLIISVITMALIITIVPFQPVAYADPFTASQIGSLAFAMANSWGISFSAGAATANGMNEFMAGQVNDYATDQSSSIADLFVGSMAVDVAGKLVVGQQLFNGVKNFIDWLIDKFDLTDEDIQISSGTVEGWTLSFLLPTVYQGKNVFQRVESYKDGIFRTRNDINYLYGTYEFRITPTSGNRYQLWADLPYTYMSRDYVFNLLLDTVDTVGNTLDWNGENYVEPTVLNPGQSWSGTVGGYSTPDTNLEDLLGDIDQAVADNNLVVDGEIVGPVPPEPTPIPIDPETPLSDVPWQGLDNNLKNLYEQGLEEIGTIGEGFNNVIDTLTDAYDSVIEWLENIYSKIDDLIDSVVDALENILEAILDIAESILNADANWFSDIVDAILTPFQRWITALKNATGIWHYIIEWLQCIATPFGFFWGILSGIGACFVKPIYAVAAFAIVIAIYKRFGK